MAAYMAILDWKLMLGTLTIGPLAFAVIRRFSGRTVRADEAAPEYVRNKVAQTTAERLAAKAAGSAGASAGEDRR